MADTSNRFAALSDNHLSEKLVGAPNNNKRKSTSSSPQQAQPQKSARNESPTTVIKTVACYTCRNDVIFVEAVNCAICQISVCAFCSKLEDCHFSALAVPNIVWLCVGCNGRREGLLDAKKILNVDNLPHSREDSKQPPNDQFLKSYIDVVCKGVKDVLQKEKDKLERSRNLIMHGISESTSSYVRLDHQIKELFSTLGCTDRPFKSQRLGRARSDHSTRPVLVECETEKIAQEMLRVAKRLRTFPRFRNVYVSPDRTKEEREERKKLIGEIKCRRERGENGLYLRGNRIIVRKNHTDLANRNGDIRSRLVELAEGSSAVISSDTPSSPVAQPNTSDQFITEDQLSNALSALSQPTEYRVPKMPSLHKSQEHVGDSMDSLSSRTIHMD